MQKHIKSILGSLASGLFFLSTAVPAFAQTFQPIDICPKTDPFKNLCGLAQKDDIFSQVVSLIISVMLIIAVIVSIIFLIWGGIRWILSGGDKAAVESARNTIIAAIIGLVVALVAFFLINIVATIILGPGKSLFNLQLPSLR